MTQQMLPNHEVEMFRSIITDAVIAKFMAAATLIRASEFEFDVQALGPKLLEFELHSLTPNDIAANFVGSIAEAVRSDS